jgi:hypothetical protein
MGKIKFFNTPTPQDDNLYIGDSDQANRLDESKRINPNKTKSAAYQTVTAIQDKSEVFPKAVYRVQTLTK